MRRTPTPTRRRSSRTVRRGATALALALGVTVLAAAPSSAAVPSGREDLPVPGEVIELVDDALDVLHNWGWE